MMTDDLNNIPEICFSKMAKVLVALVNCASGPLVSFHFREWKIQQTQAAR